MAILKLISSEVSTLSNFRMAYAITTNRAEGQTLLSTYDRSYLEIFLNNSLRRHRETRFKLNLILILVSAGEETAQEILKVEPQCQNS